MFLLYVDPSKLSKQNYKLIVAPAISDATDFAVIKSGLTKQKRPHRFRGEARFNSPY